MTTRPLRERVIMYMQDRTQGTAGWYCTWWYRSHIEPFTTKQIRAELERMEREGLIESDRSQSNNTKWRLVDKSAEVTP